MLNKIIWLLLALTAIITVRGQDDQPIKKRPTFLIQYYSWWSRDYNHNDPHYEDSLLDPFDFDAIGIHGITNCSKDNPLRGKGFDLANFKYIRSIGFDALSWQIDPGSNPPPVDQIREAGLKVAPFADVVQYVKLIIHEEMTASVPKFVMMPTDQCADLIVECLRKTFFDLVPKDLYARDAKGRVIIYVFFFLWEVELSQSLEVYDKWVEKLMNRFVEIIGERPALYINYDEGAFARYLFLNHRQYFIPFNFVLDSYQGQYGHDSVTWNFGFDNHAVQLRDGLERVMRLDPRYVTEQAWLAAATEPAAVFVYGWNEPFESTMLLPTKIWGDTKAKLAKYYINNYEEHSKRLTLPRTLLIVSDIHRFDHKKNPLIHVQIFFLARPFRLYAPHADVVIDKEVTAEMLKEYKIIIDAATIKSNKTLENMIIEEAKTNNQRLMLFDYSPKLFYGDHLTHRGGNFLRVLDTTIDEFGKKHPCIVSKDNVVFVSTRKMILTRLHLAFGALYEGLIPMGRSISFYERRVRVDPDNKEITFINQSHWSIIGQIPMPPEVNWFRSIKGLPASEAEVAVAEKYAYYINE